jgi:hypothetical protein
MSCPWFQPVSVLSSPDAMVPLGDPRTGICRAPAASGAGEGGWMELCNLGSARGRCRAFPGGDGPDGVRFSVASHREEVVTLCCVREKAYLPFDRATLVYSAAEGRFLAAHPDPLVEDQARAYVESYLCRSPRLKSA